MTAAAECFDMFSCCMDKQLVYCFRFCFHVRIDSNKYKLNIWLSSVTMICLQKFNVSDILSAFSSPCTDIRLFELVNPI